MREDQDLPRADGLRHDDPPFREHFSTQPDKPTGAVEGQRSEYMGLEQAQWLRAQYHSDRAQRLSESPQFNMKEEQLIPKDYADPREPTVIDMQDTQDVIAIIRKVASGGQYVHVGKLIEALS